MRKNSNLERLTESYLFSEIAARRAAYEQRQSGREVISLGIGDTIKPLPQCVTDAFIAGSRDLATSEGYTGYEPYEGRHQLREQIAQQIYGGAVAASEIFVADGSKPEIGRLQALFDAGSKVAVQDPSYPVYVDASLLAGRSEIVYWSCTAENGFFPELRGDVDLIYFCSPNNPTGAVATKEQLAELIAFAREQQAVIIFDTAYSCFIRDPDLPRSIYEVEGAKEVAIETNSLSKRAGFTGVRLGWTVVPKALHFSDGSSVHKSWSRIASTLFNGPSNLAQRGAMAALSGEGLAAAGEMIDSYLRSADRLRRFFEGRGFSVVGGENAPYIWVRCEGRSSWEMFDHLLEKAAVVVTPGSGFGPAGEGYIRLSSFVSEEKVEIAISRLEEEVR